MYPHRSENGKWDWVIVMVKFFSIIAWGYGRRIYRSYVRVKVCLQKFHGQMYMCINIVQDLNVIRCKICRYISNLWHPMEECLLTTDWKSKGRKVLFVPHFPYSYDLTILELPTKTYIHTVHRFRNCKYTYICRKNRISKYGAARTFISRLRT